MSEAEFRLSADTSAARKEVASFRKEYAEMVRTVEKPIAQIDSLRSVQESAKAASAEFFAAKGKVNELKAAMAQAGQPVKELDRELVKAERSLARATVEFDRQKTKVREQRTELRAAGVDTRNLANEQQRLQAEMAKAVGGGRSDLAASGIRARTAELQKQAVVQRQVNLESARQNLGVNRYRQLQAELVSTRQQYQLLRASGNLTGKELAVAQQQVTQRIRQTQAELRELNGLQARAGAGRGGMAGVAGIAAGAYSAIAAVRSISQAADAYSQMTARLKLATSSQTEFNVAQEELGRIASATQTPVSSLVTLYGRISRPLKEVGRTQSDILKVTEAVAMSFRVSGASAQEAENGVIQFSQALGAGALRGEEFNSVAEQAPRLMQALADSIGVPVGALKEMAAQGLLTAAVVTDALVGQLDTIRSEAETLPETVGGAMTALRDEWNKAIGQTDMSTLIEALKELTRTVSDPQIVEGLVNIAAGMATLAGWTINVASEFAVFADKVAFTAAQMSAGSEATAKQVAELEKLQRTLKEVEAARTGSSFFGTSTVPLLMKFFDPAGLDAWAKELEGKIKAFEQKLYGISQGEVTQESSVGEQLQDQRDADIASRVAHVADVEKNRERLVKGAEQAGKSLVAAEKKANAELKKIRDDRLAIEARYKDALAGLGGAADPSYGNAQALQAAAQQALAAKDVKGAQSNAQAALKMLQDLAAAGENTYGFEGFIQELQAIELAANDIERTNAEAKIKSIKDEMIALKSQAAELQDLKISFKLDDAALAEVERAIDALANRKIMVSVGAKYDFTTPYTLQEPEGFAGGGRIRGPGTGTSDSILARLSNGEFVVRAAAVRHYGPELLERLNQMRLQRFATGGQVGRALPAIPSPSQALLDSANPPAMQHLGSMDISFGGGDAVTIQGTPDALRELSLAARKFGRTRR